MKANELRIGNWVDIEGVEVQVEWLPLDYNYEHLTPIPLTEEWLVNFGFNPNTVNTFGKVNYWFKQGDCSIDVETYNVGNKIEKSYRYRLYSDIRTKHIIFVHQLQNLYFALTNEELILTTQ